MKQENKSEIIHDALNLLDDEMIEEVEKLRGGEPLVQKELRPWRKWAALAASVCLFIVVGGIWNAGIRKDTLQQEDENITMEDKQENIDKIQQESADQESISDNTKVTIPAMEVLLRQEDGTKADMIGFFIYEGRCYVETCDYMTKEVVGDYVCTSTGFIDEWNWTREDGYVELAGSIEEKFYEVKGINPEFMLCTIFEDGTVETYIHNNGIILDKGSELLVDQLGLDENYKQVSYLTGEEWENQYKTKQEPTVISEKERELFDKFIASFNEGDFVYAKSLDMNRDVIYGSDAIYHLYITTEEGVPLHFLLLGDGYVSFYGLNQVCVQVDEEVYSQIESILKNR